MTKGQKIACNVFAGVAMAALAAYAKVQIAGPVDPGVRGGAAGAGSPLSDLTSDELKFFNDGLDRFKEVESVKPSGLGPRFNSNSCVSCHLQPAPGGSSPMANPQIGVATDHGARNAIPWFINPKGPVREARFKRNPDGTADGGVHDLFVITGRDDAVDDAGKMTCNIEQERFLPAGNALTGQGGNPNIVFRIPTPAFGAGLIEAIPDAAILANMKANSEAKSRLGIYGHPNAHISGSANHSANDGTITRFGWKAQNKSLLMFSGEAYNVEMGVTNQLFPQERDETPGCGFNPTPEDRLNFSPAPGGSGTALLSDLEGFAVFMRMLAPPTPAPDDASIVNGRQKFGAVGCAHCHTPSLTTGIKIASRSSRTVATGSLSNKQANLYSDLIVHHMGKGLEDGITQGGAGPDEFRTAPLWGVGQRVFFLHDGRTKDLVEAIRAHRSPRSEASQVVDNFDRLSAQEKQDIVNFLRAL